MINRFALVNTYILTIIYFDLFNSLSQHNNFILNKTESLRCILSFTEIFCLGFLFLWNCFDACFHRPSLSPLSKSGLFFFFHLFIVFEKEQFFFFTSKILFSLIEMLLSLISLPYFHFFV